MWLISYEFNGTPKAGLTSLRLRREYSRLYGSTFPVGKAKPDLLVLHPGPANLGVEISEELSVHRQSVITERGNQRGSSPDGSLVFVDWGGQSR